MMRSLRLVFCGIALLSFAMGQTPTDKEPYLSWSADECKRLGKSMRKSDNVGNSFSMRGIHTDRAINYRMRATWMTPEVIRATARLIQLRDRLTDDETRALVAEAEAVGQTVMLIELDAIEGSGVIPLDWRAVLQPKGISPDDERFIVGKNNARLANVKALAGVERRDYDFDVFWVVFQLVSDRGQPMLPTDIGEFELEVRIRGKVGKVSWPIPASVRQLMLP